MAELTFVIADDHKLIRRGLRDLLATQNGWRVLGEACHGAEAVELALKLKPDVVILDFFMPELNGPAAAGQIIAALPNTGILILTMDDSEQVIREVLRVGARGLVLKSDAERDLIEAIHLVADKRQFFTSRVSKVIVGGYLAGNGEQPVATNRPTKRLTDREREVMRLLAEGMTSREAASHLQISIRTVESHRINISRKMSFGSIADLVRYAIRNGIVAHS